MEAEWTIIYNKLDECVKTGASIVLSRLPIGDLATQYFADRNIFCAGRLTEGDINRVQQATGAKIQSSVYNLTQDVLGTCGLFEEIQVGSKRYECFKDCANAQTATFILRGGAQQFLEEAERSIHGMNMMRSVRCRFPDGNQKVCEQ